MKRRSLKKMMTILSVILIFSMSLCGCGEENNGNENEDKPLSDNIVITEMGEVLERSKTDDNAAVESPTPSNENCGIQEEKVELDIPVQEQVITEEDQTELQGKGLQLVFLGDSIFDNNRDGTGVPYLTAKQCDADVLNLAIGGTSASIEVGESAAWNEWTSRSFCGVVNAMLKRISTEVFEGTRTKELLDNPNIDFSQTDYFIVEYGTNDFFRAVRLSDDDGYNITTYAGALRYGVSNLKELAPDATIILCSPMYARFFHDGYMVGDGNVTNTGYGTLYDYAGMCEYIAGEMQVEFFDAYLDLGIDGYTAEQYLEDGVHLTEAGRQLYADVLAHRILSFEETKNN